MYPLLELPYVQRPNYSFLTVPMAVRSYFCPHARSPWSLEPTEFAEQKLDISFILKSYIASFQ
jgi:hypothetical protein